MNKNRSILPYLFQEMQDFAPFSYDLEEFFHPLKTELSGISIYETDDKLYVEAAVPGLNPEEIQVSVEKGVLWIKGEKKEEEKKVKYHLKSSEIFSYRIPLPARFDESTQPEAVCKNGILKIAFTKSPVLKTQKIQIKCG